MNTNEAHKEAATGKLKTRVSMGMKVIRADGTVEEHGEQYSKVVELDYNAAVELLGKEQADQLFSGAEGDN